MQLYQLLGIANVYEQHHDIEASLSHTLMATNYDRQRGQHHSFLSLELSDNLVLTAPSYELKLIRSDSRLIEKTQLPFLQIVKTNVCFYFLKYSSYTLHRTLH